MSRITTLPIRELCRLDSIRQEYGMDDVERETFCIPDYQRGYRWDADIHVEALLNDIRDFMNMKRTSDDRYCLQPIVVTASGTTPGGWEVIDGQQRLTTLYLLLNAIDSKGEYIGCFNLRFDARAKSNDFIRGLMENNIESHENPDFHFMSAAWTKINRWLDKENKKSPGFKLKFGLTLWENVNVIWFDIESTDRNVNIDVFNRLNIGKIPLNDAELVKALLLSKIKGLYKDSHELSLRQSEINNEWQRMEVELRKPQKWGFLTGNIEREYDSHIELLFDLLAKNISKDAEDGHYTTFLWFEKQINDAGSDLLRQAEKAVELWNMIKNAFVRINTWFCDSTPDADSTLYHYIGYLLASRKEKIQTLFNCADGKSKKGFQQVLSRMVRDTIKDIDFDSLSYEDSKEEIRLILLLFNVLTCAKIADGMYNRFPFDRYNAVAKESRGHGGWSLEHIFAQNSQDPVKDKKVARRWLSDTKKSIQNIDSVVKPAGREGEEFERVSVGEIKLQIDSMLELPDSQFNLDDFNELRRRIYDIFEEPDKHPLSNMALLSKKDNSSLNNAIFPTKRDRIIELERNGRFIPPCTRNVFLKFYSPADSQPYYWGEADQKAYLDNISTVINDFKKGI